MMKNMAGALVAILAVTVAICLTQCHGLTVRSCGRSRYLNPDETRISPKENFTLDFLEAHNEARAAVGFAPLKWSPFLADTAGYMAYSLNKKDKGCQSLDMRSVASTYGIGVFNQHCDRLSRQPPCGVVDKWVEEKKYYNHANNSCAPKQKCGSYTQVEWRKSLELGCAQAICSNLMQCNTITVCVYSPPGNVPGQRPY